MGGLGADVNFVLACTDPQLETFSLLQHFHGNQERVRVWIRHCAGVRGVCEGVLLAFDKHFNLVSSTRAVI